MKPGSLLPRQRYRLLLGCGLVTLALIVVLAPLVGSTQISLARVWQAPFDWNGNPDAAIFFIARLPRVLVAALVGASLALAGSTFQSLMRNPLATPYTLGVSAGAMLTTFLAMRFMPGAVLAELTMPVAALIGALSTTALVMALATRRGDMPTVSLLLAGVTLNFSIGAVVMLLQYFADATDTARMVRWMMGDLDAVSYRVLVIAAVGTLPGWVALLRAARPLNLLGLGAEEAMAHGVDAERVSRRSLLWAAWVTGLAVAVAGPIGFVGILVPHAVRLVGGADYRVILPVAAVAGAGFLVLCDTVARTVMAPVELPVGILTACLGGPFFLLLLLRRRALN